MSHWHPARIDILVNIHSLSGLKKTKTVFLSVETKNITIKLTFKTNKTKAIKLKN
jgi:hypothetical protein